jgi:predicted acetyltransferase
MELIRPTLDRLEDYRTSMLRSIEEESEGDRRFLEIQLAQIAEDPIAFIDSQDKLQGREGLYPLPDGTLVPRMAGFNRWMWDGEVAGMISFRWLVGGIELPDYCLGHIGYGVFPWKRGKGYATQALALFLEEIRSLGLPFVELTTDPDNLASQKVILANGGVFLETFLLPESHGGGESFRYRVSF